MNGDDLGWPGSAMAFLTALAEHNSRDWFTANKPRYREAVAEPAARFLADLATQLGESAGHPFDGRIFRLARDMRFAKPGELPYHPWLRMAFQARGQAGGCYLSIEPEDIRFGVGLIAFDKTQLTAWRSAVAGLAGNALGPVEAALVGAGWRVDPPQLRRTPRGFEGEGSAARWLRHKQFCAWRDNRGCRFRSRAELQHWCVAAAEEARPLSKWLARHLPAGQCAESANRGG
ncbi:MAG: DUF2461 domain-containing protein [Rhodocyclaceae bacterium]|nr:DUF2461 domain-containing protein [Rhodocyclaceae bacterium]